MVKVRSSHTKACVERRRLLTIGGKSLTTASPIAPIQSGATSSPPGAMRLAFIDELGHPGHYISKSDPKHNSSPLSGYGGFVIPADRIRALVTEVIQVKARYLRDVSFANATMRGGRPMTKEEAIKAAIQHEIKANEVFGPEAFEPTTPPLVRKRIGRLAAKTLELLVQHGGRPVYFAKEKKSTTPEDHKATALENMCLRRLFKIINSDAHKSDTTSVIVLDHHVDHKKKTALIAYSMASGGYLKRCAEPPFIAYSELSHSIQISDWICGLVNKIFIHTSSKNAEWPGCAAYYSRFHSALVAGQVPGSRVA